MNIDADFTKLEQEVRELDRKRDRAIGGRDADLARLKSQFGVSGREEALKLISKLNQQKEALAKKYRKAREVFNQHPKKQLLESS